MNTGRPELSINHTNKIIVQKIGQNVWKDVSVFVCVCWSEKEKNSMCVCLSLHYVYVLYISVNVCVSPFACLYACICV